ncbi:DUF2243 domain-containing protein [Phenylobacterium sp.]|uniref:DUF2243 domain-containing protein n=1 Tax=Phenylobacterium sp. TaxID=1871053 RepID=UPI00272FB2CB|nr:DUF2243 domain-containing protein [Phenylobacterium sp.]MDP2212845.1 DUF2243 domain-containing protein [Phenylobacterium sp.]
MGFALGGFFDGILLHQILQWHHLLSLTPGIDLRGQILWDGYFHAAMYLLAALALWGLWRTHKAGAPLSGRPLCGALLAGFGAWHVVDSVLSHWLIGIHRIRVDSANPLAWDLVWFIGFGLVPAALGWWLLRPSGGAGTGSLSRRSLVALIAVTLAAAGWALRGPADSTSTTVVFQNSQPGAVFAALAATEARLIWADPHMNVMVLDIPRAKRWALYRHGALLVSGTGGPAGCVSWSRP